ncbi:uncharacterized protein LOC143634751 [Bidens hawaiensis]|uniref:uncharacterized protein LOC143634751 n=1 Tax=Bidens hawaiensis TaxID=980011 RepID=UPI0040493D29
MKTPYQIVYGHKPTVAHFRAFGCPCTLLNLETTPKFGAKADVCYFVRYAALTAYRVYNNSTKQIVESYDVRWPEENETDALVDTYNSGAGAANSVDEEEYIPNDSHMSPVLSIDPSESLDTTEPLSSSQQESIEPKLVEMALQEPRWVEAMHEELNHFIKLKVWRLVELPVGKKVEGLDYTKVYALVARLEAIRIFLAFASYMGFTVYQMDAKTTFLYGEVKEGIYVD